MFTAHLQGLLDRAPDAVSVTLMGFDGIAIETCDAAHSASFDPQAAAIELGSVVTQLRRVSADLGTGDVAELSLETQGMTTVLRPITDEYFLAVALRPGANIGKARYLLRVIAPKLQGEL
ncbi:MAG: roadblock/LC7 domain-containing protein [Myxococcota bacterium]